MKPELLKAIDPYLRRVGLYSAYTLDEKEFVGSVGIDTSNVFKKLEDRRPPFVMEHDFYNTLTANGYETSPTFAGITLEAAKIHPKTGDVHDVSLRKVDPENNQKQYHLHYWLESVEEGYEAQLFSHHEYRPDVRILDGETLSEAIERLKTHYRPEWGESYIRGKADQTVRGLVE
jgi:hypothetical protein